jgi:transposase
MDQVIRHRPAVCAHCQTPLDEQCAGELTGRHQVAELPACAVKLTEHQSYACRCECCGKVTRALIPPEIVASATGPRLTAAIGILGAWVKGSRRAVAEVIGQTLGCPIALGSISAREVELTQALQQPYEELASRLSQAPVKYVDETGWKLRGQNRWLFVAATPQEVLFKVERNRTRPALLRLLGGKARGTICSDRCVIYELWPLDKRQLCWAHLKRDFVAAVERGGPGQVPAQQALDITAEIFELWRDFKAGRLTRRQLREQIKPLQSKMRHALESGARCGQKKTAGLCRRLLKREQAMWRFIDTRGLDPTNNLAERMLRPAVIWRKKSFGCHSQQGCHYVERMLSVIQTLRLRGVDVLDYLSAAVEAHRKGLPPPALPPPVNERPTETSGKPQTDAVTPFALDLRKVA